MDSVGVHSLGSRFGSAAAQGGHRAGHLQRAREWVTHTLHRMGFGDPDRPGIALQDAPQAPSLYSM